mgnify:CR=1 FL=1|jgi:hypothetical protein|tara:strand:+ start:525 stop:824 length:300 start_codon:yes stop_codon:yes gene_type:complete
MASSDYLQQWENLIEDIDKQKIPLEFIKKLVLRLVGRKQLTINIERLEKQGLEKDQIELAIGKKLSEMEDDIINIDFILNVERIAEAVQPETDKFLEGL